VLGYNEDISLQYWYNTIMADTERCFDASYNSHKPDDSIISTTLLRANQLREAITQYLSSRGVQAVSFETDLFDVVVKTRANAPYDNYSGCRNG
jgi:hypothetical protein